MNFTNKGNINELYSPYLYTFCYVTLMVIFSFIYGRSNFKFRLFINFHLIQIGIDFNYKFETSRNGPGALMRGLLDSAKTFQGKCSFKKWSLNYSQIEHNINQIQFYYIPDGTGFCKNAPRIAKKDPEKLLNTIYGPFNVPLIWNQFPSREFCTERKFSRSLDMMGLYIVHSTRVRDYLAQKSRTTNKLQKYGIMQACTNLKPPEIKPFNQRRYDIILYEKYADLNRELDGQTLYKLILKANFTVLRLSYNGGVKNASGYNYSSLIQIAKNTKFIIYFSFWDTGAISLKEIQNFGVYSFSVQQDLIYNQTGLFVPELDGKIEAASEIILNKIKNISIEGIDTQKVADFNQYQNSCQRSLEDLCNEVVNKLVPK